MRARFLAGLVVLMTLISLLGGSPILAATEPAPEMVRLPGHVLPALAKATVIPSKPGSDKQQITLTVVLKRDDQAGFERYLHDVYDPHSKNFRHFLTQSQIADRFGPSRGDYGRVLRYLRRNGLVPVETTVNRLTLGVQGTRAAVEQALHVAIQDYKIGNREFRANEVDPTLPLGIGAHVQSVAGLSDYATPDRATEQQLGQICGIGGAAAGVTGPILPIGIAIYCAILDLNCFSNGKNICAQKSPPPPPPPPQPRNRKKRRRKKSKTSDLLFAGAAPTSLGPDGTGQKVGLVEFDSFQTSDVADFLNLLGMEPTEINNLSVVQVNGGTSIGPNEDEVLLDIDAIMAVAPGAQIAVYEAPFAGTGSFQSVFNRMISDKVTIISNSWAYCEDQTTLADVQGIDSIFQNAAVAGISVFNGAGDHGSTCLDGSPNTVSVPADSPNATAVGGTSVFVGPGGTYGSETWWNGVSSTPQTGQGGFGLSTFFSAPAYQSGISPSGMRSVPDVVAQADPATGTIICQADAGGCPTPLSYGGTSYAAPLWAAYTALLNDSLGVNLGAFNTQIYPLAHTNAFHDAASMGSDFAHVGLGSPNLDALDAALFGDAIGTPDPALSEVDYTGNNVGGLQLLGGVTSAPADGKSQALIVVQLIDADGDTVSGKTVTLTTVGPSSAKISPASAITNSANGAAVFTLTDLAPEDITLMATDTTDSVVISEQPTVSFVTPSAASGSIGSAPSSIVNDGVTTSTVTVLLTDTLGRPAPGKQITLNPSIGTNSIISGPTPSVTDSSGSIQFKVADSTPETVTYTATDVTDGNLPIPGSADVLFTGTPGNGCNSATLPAAPGFIATPYVTGILFENVNYGSVAWGCRGAEGIAFDSAGNLYVNEFPSGNIYKFPPGGGVASNATLLTKTAIYPSLAGMVIDSNDHLFVSEGATTGNFFTGDVVQVDPSSGSVLKTLSSGLTCPFALAQDPLSGDLFTDSICTGTGADDFTVKRISNPLGASPTTSVYATLSGIPNVTIAFGPGGTMYVWSFVSPNVLIAKVSGTNVAGTPTVSTLPNLNASYLGLIATGQQASSDDADSLWMTPSVGGKIQGIGMADLTTSPPSLATSLTTGVGANHLVLGPGGCIFASQGTTVYKITDLNGGCNYTTPASPTITLSPTLVSPSPAQGSTQLMTAALHYFSPLAGTPVTFSVNGANVGVGLANADTNGKATFSYTGRFSGNDIVTASADDPSGTVTSNQVSVAWGAGKDVTNLTLNQSPSAATPGQTVTLAASLTDVSVNPATAIAGQSVNFTLGSTGCGGTTDAKGNVTCTTTAGSAGVTTLSASYPGNGSYVASNASQGFTVVAAAATPTATPTPVGTPTPTATLKAQPSTMDFPNVVATTQSHSQKLHLTSVGKIPALIGQLVAPASFSLANDSCSSQLLIHPCSADVTFAPTATGNVSEQMSIPYNGAALSVTLKGEATPPAVSGPKSVNLGAVKAGGFGPGKLVKLTNRSTLSVRMLSPNITALGGASDTDFTVDSDSCIGKTLAPKGKCTLKIALTPGSGAIGTLAGTLNYNFSYGNPAAISAASVPLKGKVPNGK